MPDQPLNPHRHPMRLPGYDYSLQGAYFVTIVTHNREQILSTVQEESVVLSPTGRIVQSTWLGLPDCFHNLVLDEMIVMPDHVHGILILELDHRHSLPEIVRYFKSRTGRAINRIRGVMGEPVWQRSYFERIIRNDRELDTIRNYILDNPRRAA